MERRRHRRFDVSQLDRLYANTSGDPVGEKLLSLSAGGCAFSCSSTGFAYKVGERLEVAFKIKDEPKSIKLEGHVIYINPMPMSSEVGRHFCIAFMSSHSAGIANLIHKIEAFSPPELAYINSLTKA